MKNKSGYNVRQKVSRYSAWGLLPPSRTPIRAFSFQDARKRARKGSGDPALDLSAENTPTRRPRKYPAIGFPTPRQARHLPCILPKIPVQMQVLYPPYILVGTPTRTPRRNTILASTLLASRHLNGSCILACLAASIPMLTQMQLSPLSQC